MITKIFDGTAWRTGFNQHWGYSRNDIAALVRAKEAQGWWRRGHRDQRDGVSHPWSQDRTMPARPFDDDPVPPDIILDLGEALRVLEALEDALLALERAGQAPGLQDELATVIRVLHVRLGFDEGGLR